MANCPVKPCGTSTTGEWVLCDQCWKSIPWRLRVKHLRKTFMYMIRIGSPILEADNSKFNTKQIQATLEVTNTLLDCIEAAALSRGLIK